MWRHDFVAFLATIPRQPPVFFLRAPSRTAAGDGPAFSWLVEDDPQAAKYLGAFRDVLRRSGWRDGQKSSNRFASDYRSAVTCGRFDTASAGTRPDPYSAN